MQVRLPVVVIGGGLTAIDTATESLAYYRGAGREIPRALRSAGAEQGRAARRSAWTSTSARSPRNSSRMRARSAPSARAAARAPTAAIVELLQVVGRRDHRVPPAADRQSVVHAEPRGGREGAGGRHPLRRGPDAARDRGRRVRARAACASRCNAAMPTASGRGERDRCPRARSSIAAGTQPNTVLAREDGVHFHARRQVFPAPATRTASRCKPGARTRQARRSRSVLTARIAPTAAAMSFFGDLHPSFFGNVVKAMAQREAGLSDRVAACWRSVAAASRRGDADFLARLNDELRATSCTRSSASRRRIVEVVVRAPAAARRFQPGPVLPPAELRVARAARRRARALAMEGLALTGAWVDREQGLVSTIVLEMGGSSDLCALLKPGRAGGADGPDRHADRDRSRRDRRAGRRRPRQRGAVLDRPGVPRSAGSKVLYFAGYKTARSTATRSTRSRPRPTWSSGAATRRPGFAPHAAAGPRLRRQHRAGDAGLRERRARARRRSRSRTPTASSPSAPTA